MNKVTRNYIYNLLYQLFVIIVPIITAPYLARVLGPDNQGIFSYVQSFTNTISTITLLGISSYGNRQIAYERDNIENLNYTFWEIMICRIILGAIGSIFYLTFLLNLSEYKIYFMFYYIWLIGTYLDCTWLYVGVEDMKPAVIKNFFAKLMCVLGIFIFVKKRDDLLIYIIIFSLSVFIANISAYSQLNKYINKPKVRKGYLLKHIKGAFHLFLPYMATLLYLQLDKIMIKWLTNDPSQVSFYDNSEKIVTIPLTIITVLSTVMMPRIANEYKKGNIEIMNNYLINTSKVSLFLAFPMMIGLMVIAKNFVPWYLGSEYYPVVYGIIIIAPIVVSNTLEGISGKQYFTATNQINILAKSYISTAIINIILNYFLIPHIGFYGAAIATLISSYICIIIQYFYLIRQIPILNLLSYLLRFFSYAVIMGGIVYLLTNKLGASFMVTIIQAVLGFLIYIVLCYLFKDELVMYIYKTLFKK